jgi:hypothetical protein
MIIARKAKPWRHTDSNSPEGEVAVGDLEKALVILQGQIPHAALLLC